MNKLNKKNKNDFLKIILEKPPKTYKIEMAF